jgi:hypothetical protein
MRTAAWAQSGRILGAQLYLRLRFPFRLARGAEILTFHALESFRGCEETESTPIANDDSGRFRPDFDDIRIRHCTFTCRRSRMHQRRRIEKVSAKIVALFQHDSKVS